MRSALMTTVRRRSTVIAGSAGLATVCAAAALALVLPSSSAVAEAPAAVVADGHRDDFKLSVDAVPASAAPVAADFNGKLDSAPYLQPVRQEAGHTLTVAPYQAAQEQSAPATQAAAPAEQPAAEQPAAEQPAPQSAAPSTPPAVTDTSPSGVRALARSMVPADQWASFANIVSHESSWNINATNAGSGAYGLGQALPAGKMASAGSDWRGNPVTQIKWALNYMNERYGSPNQAWVFWQNHHWY
ncbi:transglycosylase SLT domain-containing protein [Kitasatospora sp. NPDC052896]|uniref:aggregation-promoting factor C-terminal-like domain-containing protein n=1 Tax=Kitasatospora sp. NPDC052896 TaxID=3364061 RepID=UPI0037C54E56